MARGPRDTRASSSCSPSDGTGRRRRSRSSELSSSSDPRGRGIRDVRSYTCPSSRTRKGNSLGRPGRTSRARRAVQGDRSSPRAAADAPSPCTRGRDRTTAVALRPPSVRMRHRDRRYGGHERDRPSHRAPSPSQYHLRSPRGARSRPGGSPRGRVKAKLGGLNVRLDFTDGLERKQFTGNRVARSWTRLARGGRPGAVYRSSTARSRFHRVPASPGPNG